MQVVHWPLPEQGKSLQLALLFLPARWSWGEQPCRAGHGSTFCRQNRNHGNPSCSRQGLKPGWAGHGFIFCSHRSAKLKPWESRLFPNGLGPQGETTKGHKSTTVIPPSQTSQPQNYVLGPACSLHRWSKEKACSWHCSFCLLAGNRG